MATAQLWSASNVRLGMGGSIGKTERRFIRTDDRI
jgi:hypothetical protein